MAKIKKSFAGFTLTKAKRTESGFTLTKAKRTEAFTLIELLIVVCIIALLILLVINLLIRNIAKANDAKRKADIAKISTALENYYTDNNCYPDPSIFSSCGSTAFRPYLDSIPCDPVYKYPYCYFVNQDSGSNGCWQKYRALATLKFLSDRDISSLGCNDKTNYCGWEVECGATSERYGFNYGVASRNQVLTNPSEVTIPSGATPPSGLPSPDGPGSFACAFDGVCNNFGSYQNAINQGCPITFSSFSTCQSYCDYSSTYWCPQ